MSILNAIKAWYQINTHKPEKSLQTLISKYLQENYSDMTQNKRLTVDRKSLCIFVNYNIIKANKQEQCILYFPITVNYNLEDIDNLYGTVHVSSQIYSEQKLENLAALSKMSEIREVLEAKFKYYKFTFN